MTNKIFITGCAKSGTTLLLRLFYSFKDVEVVHVEIPLFRLIDMNSKNTLVAKRDAQTIFSNSLSVHTIEIQKTLIEDNNIKIINIVRDGRDVVESDRGYVPAQRWIDSLTQTFEHMDNILLNVKYEQLVSTPDIVQGWIRDLTGLRPECKFSAYPDFVPSKAFLSKTNHNKPRPIEVGRIGKDLGLYKRLCSEEQLEDFESFLKKLSYIE